MTTIDAVLTDATDIEDLEIVQPIATATPVTVTATLVDSTSNPWNSATVIVQFVPGFGVPAGKYTWNGADFTRRQEFVTTGNSFSIQLPSNDKIIPIDSLWNFTISGNSLTPAVVITKYLDSRVATTFDLSAQFKSIAPPLNTTGGSGGPVPQIIKVADQATALAQSAANPNNFYYWV